jgi:acyl-CoA synthetase (NDP forming)/N-acetylglutamate synthase-like GNAT family acetyltransferase
MTPASDRATDDGLDVLTVDGAIVRIRPARPDDAEALTALHDRASAETLYRRFLSTGKNPIAHEVIRLVRPRDDDHVALVAVENGDVIGVASYELLPARDRAEFAVFVDDAAHDRGIGTLLLEHLAVHARRNGIPELFGEVLPQNSPMLRVAGDLGRPSHLGWELGLVEVRLATDDDGGDAIDARDLTAARNSLRSLFMPATVAVVGAGREPTGIGHAIVRAIVDGGFTGRLYPVNPKAEHIAGLPCYPSIGAVPGQVDLAVIAVPAQSVPEVLRDAAAAGVRVAVIVSSGFSEVGPAGRELQSAIVRIARTGGMRLVGPNCLGFLTTDPLIRLNATFAASAPPGGLALASQSGAVGISVLGQAARAGLGIASFVSLGNKADVSGNDLLSYWYDDPAARVIALYLESLGNPRRFARIARTVSMRKPVLVVKSGRTAAGSRAGASHTAAAAAPDATVDALFAQAGVVRCDGLGDLIDTARMFADQPLPRGNRVAIVGNAGGINVLCADAAEAAGLSIPALSEEISGKIRAVASAAPAAANPIDLGAAASAEAIGVAIRAAATGADSVVVAYGATHASDAQSVLAAIEGAIDEVDVPVAVILLGLDEPPTSMGTRRAPVYALPETAIKALGRAVRYGRWRATPHGVRTKLTGIDSRRARKLVDDHLGRGAWLSSTAAADILSCYGIPTTPTLIATTETAALSAATELGYPVVLKTASSEAVHKTDIGGVRLDLRDANAVVAAYHAIVAATGVPQVLVQAHVPGGVELVAGIVHDPLFGSVLMCGMGGVQTELFGDRSLRVLPVTDRDAAEMWRNLRGAPLLTGYRGAPAVDTAAVEDLIQRLGRLAEDLPEVSELDLNPLIVQTSGVAAVDVKMRLAAVGDEPDASLRTLREPK